MVKSPVRSCVVCRGRDAKERLVRLVADTAGRIRIDARRREPGRGAYVHPSRACIDGLPRKREVLGRTLKRNVVVTENFFAQLSQHVGCDPDDRAAGPLARFAAVGEEARPRLASLREESCGPVEGETATSPDSPDSEES